MLTHGCNRLALASDGQISLVPAMVTKDHTAVSEILLTDLPPTRRQTRAAITVVLMVIVAFALVAPFSGRQATTLNAFFPSLDAIVLVTDLITAVLLYTQFSISRSRSLLVLASGYLFTAFIVIPHALTFSGAFSPTGLFGAGLQTGSWLFIFWHIGFAAALLGYALSKDLKRGRLAAETAVVREISWSVVTVLALVSGIAWLTTGGEALLPPIILDKSRLSPFVIYPIWFTVLITAAGLVILAFRRRSVLDLWLMVVAAVFIGELAFSGLLPIVRFSVGFYAGRAFSLVTSSIVLIVLLAEMTLLYVHLARSNDLLQRERHDKLMSMEAMAALITHEVNQPLGSILTNVETMQSMLQSSSPDISEIREIAADINRDDVRASEVLRRIRALLKKVPFEAIPIDLNEKVRQAVAVLSGQAAARQVEVSTAIGFPLLPISGDRVQIQQVLVNLIVNAMDAMSENLASNRRLTIQTSLRDEFAEVAIADSGPGIPADKLQGVFEPFVTTKAHGMGMGLSIARTIIEAHNGTISADNQAKGGAVFRIRLPLRKS